MKIVLICTAAISLAAILVATPALAEQSITITLDVPQLDSDTSSTSQQPTLEANKAPAGSSNASSVKGKSPEGTTIGRVGIVEAQKASIYRSRSSSKVLATCGQGTPIGIVGEQGNWYGVLMVDMSTGWIRKTSVKLLDYDLVAAKRRPSRDSAVGQQIVQVALKYTGVPYVWGGNTTGGIDCSGFVKAVYSDFGINLPRVAREQVNVGAPVTWDDLQAGDRLYFACKGAQIDHTGIYMGNGLFIHSSSSRGGVGIDNINSSFYAKSLVAARRS